MICFDSSVAVKLIFPEAHADKAKALYRSALDAREPIVAPPLLPVEVSNVIRQRMRSESLPISQARRLLQGFLAFPILTVTHPVLHERALDAAALYDLPAVYDAQYLALCGTLGALLWTDDQRLLKVLSGRFPLIRWIGDFQVC